MIVDLAMDAGEGLWHQQFEALKRKLSEEGLFDPAHKRPIPRDPLRVAVVTAVRGAAVRDFIRIAGERGTGAEIRIFPTPVQGEEAPPCIAGALRTAAGDGWPEVVVLIRGGGSIQDLWAFNDEQVVRAVHDCPIPVLTGIGHEIDTSLSDLAADLSAATPSHTAQLLWTERSQMQEQLSRAEEALFQSMDGVFERCGQQRESLVRTLRLLSPEARLKEKARTLDNSVRLMRAALQNSVHINSAALEKLVAALTRKADLAESRGPALQALIRRLGLSGEMRLTETERKTDRLASRLFALDPFAPLKRGYAFASAGDGSFLHSVEQTRTGDAISVRLADGLIHARVESVEPINE